MHGIIFGELKGWADAKLGGDSWRKVLEEAGLGSKLYMPVGEYPDGEATQIIGAIARRTGKDVKVAFEEFGEFIAPHLIALYQHMVNPKWRTLELLENTECTMHRVVRSRNPGARPPQLETKRQGKEVLITYSSHRKMCGVAIGIVRGIAHHYRENVQIRELACMAAGATECRILVRALGPSS
jgi:predicted hydrocarbon binding protein